MTLPFTTRSISIDDARALFDARGEGETFDWFEENHEIVQDRRQNQNKPAVEILLSGPVRLPSLKLQSPWIVVVDGDLDVELNIDLTTEPYDLSAFVVFGTVSARNRSFGLDACARGHSARSVHARTGHERGAPLCGQRSANR